MQKQHPYVVCHEDVEREGADAVIEKMRLSLAMQGLNAAEVDEAVDRLKRLIDEVRDGGVMDAARTNTHENLLGLKRSASVLKSNVNQLGRQLYAVRHSGAQTFGMGRVHAFVEVAELALDSAEQLFRTYADCQCSECKPPASKGEA